ncbi:hypothetical protein R3X25_05795 [Lutibacter sp. TH_r2]|uniref:hypothetical protein n=1 Tax=Lutibacter sp. TH_r2 TaxID=3082083 RepID=UPI002952A92A|nr:hypothetical protein [Lutibacter sp. TH_r2]MDV7186789.1 hypothetical protein [Lutibacter sp. TH_r2]
MLANFFSKSTPIKVFYLIIVFAIFYFLAVLSSLYYENSFVFWLSKLGVLTLFIFYVFVGSFINRKNSLTLDNLYAFLLTVLLLASFKQTFFNINFLFSNIFLLFSFRKIYSLKSGIKTKLKLFDAAIWIGISALFFEWNSVFLLLVYIGMFIHQRVSFKNIFIPIVGFIAPIFLFFTYCFYTDSFSIFIQNFQFRWSFDFLKYNSIQLLIPFTFLLTVLLWSLIIVTPNIIVISNKLKKSWYILIVHLLLALLVVVVSPVKDGSEILFLIFPATIVIANYLPKSKSENFKNLILYLFVGIAISVYFL